LFPDVSLLRQTGSLFIALHQRQVPFQDLRKCFGRGKIVITLGSACALSWAMAIYRLLQNTAFEPKDIERLVTAYEQTLRALRLKDRSDPITQLVAEKIVAVGRLGIEDPAEISKLALKELEG
jgi:hypothetical protein